MSILPKLFSLPVIVLLAWMGANIYQDNEIFANPFAEQTIVDKMKSGNTDLVKDKVEQANSAAKETFKEGVNGLADKLKDLAE